MIQTIIAYQHLAPTKFLLSNTGLHNHENGHKILPVHLNINLVLPKPRYVQELIKRYKSLPKNLPLLRVTLQIRICV